VIASDAHDPVHRHPRLDEACAAVAAQYGNEIAELLFTENPRAIIRGQFVPSDRIPPPERRKWWQFRGPKR
jgi:tyrosine-protein phosphatase YwqE